MQGGAQITSNCDPQLMAAGGTAMGRSGAGEHVCRASELCCIFCCVLMQHGPIQLTEPQAFFAAPASDRVSQPRRFGAPNVLRQKWDAFLGLTQPRAFWAGGDDITVQLLLGGGGGGGRRKETQLSEGQRHDPPRVKLRGPLEDVQRTCSVWAERTALGSALPPSFHEDREDGKAKSPLGPVPWEPPGPGLLLVLEGPFVWVWLCRGLAAEGRGGGGLGRGGGWVQYGCGDPLSLCPRERAGRSVPPTRTGVLVRCGFAGPAPGQQSSVGPRGGRAVPLTGAG